MDRPGIEGTMNKALPLRDTVFQTLQQEILHGDLKPGERLMEIHLANKLGVSRTPIREAIRMLEQEGLVRMIPRRGAVVAGITEKDLRDVLEVRKALEELAVRLACQNITEQQIRELGQAEKRVADALENGDVMLIARADMDYHDIINLATGNQRLIRFLNTLREQTYRYRVEYLKNQAYHVQLLEEHRELSAAICRRDSSEAAEIIARHIANQEQAVCAAISSKTV